MPESVRRLQVTVVPGKIPLQTISDVARTLDAVGLSRVNHQLRRHTKTSQRLIQLFADPVIHHPEPRSPGVAGARREEREGSPIGTELRSGLRFRSVGQAKVLCSLSTAGFGMNADIEDEECRGAPAPWTCSADFQISASPRLCGNSVGNVRPDQERRRAMRASMSSASIGMLAIRFTLPSRRMRMSSSNRTANPSSRM